MSQWRFRAGPGAAAATAVAPSRGRFPLSGIAVSVAVLSPASRSRLALLSAAFPLVVAGSCDRRCYRRGVRAAALVLDLDVGERPTHAISRRLQLTSWHRVQFSEMANSKYEYVKSFEVQDVIMRPTPSSSMFMPVVSAAVHEFEKPNDVKALELMNECAIAVMEQFPDVIFSYGCAGEHR
ncbi:hypothetical protein SASPL_157339 [Salvia splendens]|uniref:tRNAHis guanylyltransferase catalytic domain-containing protein n=1 Tax=Salvia splendens TaxID=180675 RepID=A0A8X8VV18_SALSN|nr:hypothetical protein SASPL_157339 [Salvia splendens]